MNTLSFIHTADLHLDTPFRGIGAIDPDVAKSLQDASLDAYDRIINLAIERDVDFVLFAGDIYDGAERGVRAQIRFKNGLVRLNENNIRAYVIHGNHDPLDGWSAIDSFPENTHVFGSTAEAIAFEKDGRVVATIHGASYRARHVSENVALTYEATGEGFQIALLHTGLDDSSGNYMPCALDDLVASGIDYWAFGHIHDRHVLCERPYVAYPGNHQGRSFNEEGARGVLHVQVENWNVETSFVPVDKWRFETVSVDIATLEDVAELVDEAISQIDALDDSQSYVLRVKLVGRGPLFTNLDLSLPQLEDEIRSQTRDTVFLARVENHTRPDLDLDAIRTRDDFAAEVLNFELAKPVLLENCSQKKHRRTVLDHMQDALLDDQQILERARRLGVDLLIHGDLS